MEAIENKVAASSLISLNLEDYFPIGDRVIYDLKDDLFEGLILREKDFRSAILEHDWTQYEEKYVGITCSVDAIVPTWAYMLVATKLQPNAAEVVFGDLDLLNDHLMLRALDKIKVEDFKGAKVVIKGCGDLPISTFVYVELTRKLTPVVSSLMFGEPCSTVPIYKRPKTN